MKFRFNGDQDCPDWILAEVATISSMSLEMMTSLLKEILSYAIAGTFDTEMVFVLAERYENSVSDLKGAIAAVNFLVTNAAKYNLDEISLSQEIQQLGLRKDIADLISGEFDANCIKLRERFALDSYRISSLQNIDWRIDQVISTSKAEDKKDLLAHLRLKVKGGTGQNDGENTEDIAFELSPEHLDVMIHEISQAHELMKQSDHSTAQ